MYTIFAFSFFSPSLSFSTLFFFFFVNLEFTHTHKDKVIEGSRDRAPEEVDRVVSRVLFALSLSLSRTFYILFFGGGRSLLGFLNRGRNFLSVRKEVYGGGSVLKGVVSLCLIFDEIAGFVLSRAEAPKR